MGENRRRRKQQAEMIQIAARMAEMLARLKKTPTSKTPLLPMKLQWEVSWELQKVR